MSDLTPRIRYTAGLQEAAVDHLLRRRREAGDAAQYERYRRAADRLYIQHVDPEARLEAFRLLYARLFEELGCGRAVVETVRRFAGRIADVLVSRAWSRFEEGAELSADRQTIGLRILPERFASPPDLDRLLRHEAERIADMLDETFGYGAGLPDGPTARRSLGGRFGWLWDCSIDGRIARRGEAPWRSREAYARTCCRVFPALAPGEAGGLVGRLWDGPRPDYPLLVRMASDLAALAAWAGVSLSEDRRSGPVPGTPCPLCGFPTHAWAVEIDTAVAALIRRDFPAWQPSQGACERCVEAYALQRLVAP